MTFRIRIVQEDVYVGPALPGDPEHGVPDLFPGEVQHEVLVDEEIPEDVARTLARWTREYAAAIGAAAQLRSLDRDRAEPPL